MAMSFGEKQADVLQPGQRWVDGSGLAGSDPEKLVGKLVACRGYGKGRVEKYNKNRVGQDTFSVNLGVNGGRDTHSLKLRRWRTGASGVEFKVADEFDPKQPHRYSCERTTHTGPPFRLCDANGLLVRGEEGHRGAPVSPACPVGRPVEMACGIHRGRCGRRPEPACKRMG